MGMKTDLLVVGGGAAGIAAGVAAARSGASVLLIERYGFLGGMATAAMVGTICGLYHRGKGDARYAVHGFARTFAERVAAQSGTSACTFEHDLHFLPYEPHVFNSEAVRVLTESGVDLLLHTAAGEVHTEDGTIRAISAIGPDRKIKIEAAAVIDCTGEALVSNLAGLPTYQQTTYQAGAFVFRVSGLPESAPYSVRMELIRCVSKGVLSGALNEACKRISIVPGSLFRGSALFKLGMPAPLSDAPDARTDYETTARSEALALIDYLRQAAECFRALFITAMAPQVGIRTGRRPIGQTTLHEKDVLQCLKPDDGIAIGVWPIEYWGGAQSPEMTYFAENDHYLIQAGTLVSSKLDNLFFAGRGLSATEMAIASARVIGTCLETGYAAGMLAAASIIHGRWQTAVVSIRRQQLSQDR